MEKVKTIVDREPVSSDYIGSKQNFGHVLSQVKNLKPPIWKTGWFYGPVGVAVIAITLSVTTIDPLSPEPDKSKTITKELKAYLNETTPTQKIKHSVNVHARPKKEVHNSIKVPDRTIIPEPTEVVEEVDFNKVAIKSEPVIKQNRSAFSETEEKPKKLGKNFFPHFQGNYTGEIPYQILCSEEGIKCNDEIGVIGFKIAYYVGSEEESKKVVGNRIPEDVCEAIKLYNLGTMLFITDIKGVNADGKVVSLTSMNITPTK